jgi:hypothetical protein
MGIAIALVVLALLVIQAARRVIAVRNRRAPLWQCPVCAADAVSALEREPVSEVLARLEVRCGDCGTWRRILTTQGSARLLERKLERHASALRKLADRLERDRAVDDADAFLTTLRSEIAGADDFLARTQAFSDHV